MQKPLKLLDQLTVNITFWLLYIVRQFIELFIYLFKSI